MDISASSPPPGAASFAAPAPGVDLRKLDNKRVLARLIDMAVLLIPTGVVVTAFHDLPTYGASVCVAVLYFFLCEALYAQTPGKVAMRLRVMRRDGGGAPSVSAVAVRSAVRLIDDNILGAMVIVLSGKRRQRLGDLLAGTQVGPATSDVPRPAAMWLLFAFPVLWVPFGYFLLSQAA